MQNCRSPQPSDDFNCIFFSHFVWHIELWILSCRNRMRKIFFLSLFLLHSTSLLFSYRFNIILFSVDSLRLNFPSFNLQMWIDSVIEYDIIVETLTGSEIEVTVTDDDTIGYIKTHIQKYEGKPINSILFCIFFLLSFICMLFPIKIRGRKYLRKLV